MRRIGHLWPAVTSFANLHRAATEALRGKRHRPYATAFFGDLESNLLEIQEELRSRRYRPGSYRTFWIREPKARLISAAPFRDRVVHHALVRVIEPIFERRFILHSYACRPAKGTHRARARFIEWARSSRYVLKLDVHKFFPSVDHAILKAALRRGLKDRDALWLCDLIIDGSNDQEPVTQYFGGDDLFSPFDRRRGVPIGNLTSQFFGNVYLDSLDHHVIDELGHGRYLRYVDDFCCFGDDKAELRDLRARVSAFLATRLRLRLNEGKSRIRRVEEGVEFLGFVVLPTELRLNQTAVRRQRRRVRKLRRAFATGTSTLEAVAASLRAWHAHAAAGTTWHLRTDVSRAARFVRGSRHPEGGGLQLDGVRRGGLRAGRTNG